MMKLARVVGTTLTALVACFPMLLARRPKTPLRVFCIAAFEYFARLHGGTLGKKRRLALAHACDFGSLRNDYYDHKTLDRAEYRSLRSNLRHMAPETATSHYIQQLRQAERNRPSLTSGNPEVANAVIAYRTRVLDLTLEWLQAISGLNVDPVQFHALLSLGSLAQLADDLLDWKEDQSARQPSYVTAFLIDRPPSAVASPLRAEADALLLTVVGAARQDAVVAPLAVAGAMTWTFIIALLRLRFPR
jgi:hypothetical protein